MKGLVNIHLNQFRDVLVILVCAVAAAVGGISNTVAAEPELKVIPQDGCAHPTVCQTTTNCGHAYRIVCEVSWAGNASDYTILPAEADPVDWGTVALTEAKAFVRNDAAGARNIVSQTIEITPASIPPNNTGSFKTPAIRIAYFNPEATPPAESAAPPAAAPGTVPPVSSASPSLGADPFDLMVCPDRSPIWISGGLGASLLLTALGWWSVRRLRRPQPTLKNGVRDSGLGSRERGESTSDVVAEAIRLARVHRQEGDFYKFYLELARAASSLPDPGEPPNLAAALKARAQEVGYRDARPTDDQMDGDLRDLERAVARHKETLQT